MRFACECTSAARCTSTGAVRRRSRVHSRLQPWQYSSSPQHHSGNSKRSTTWRPVGVRAVLWCPYVSLARAQRERVTRQQRRDDSPLDVSDGDVDDLCGDSEGGACRGTSSMSANGRAAKLRPARSYLTLEIRDRGCSSSRPSGQRSDHRSRDLGYPHGRRHPGCRARQSGEAIGRRSARRHTPLGRCP